MAMKPAIPIIASNIKAVAQTLRFLPSAAKTAPVVASAITTAAHTGNMFQPIVSNV
jgi:hypothetical protein